MASFGQSAATLTVRRGPGLGRSFTIETPSITIGRQDQCDFQVNDTFVSRQHARITWGGAGYLLEDLGTVNGTFLNGERISVPRALKSGDVIQLGTQVELDFTLRPSPSAGWMQDQPQAPAFPESSPAPSPAFSLADTEKEEARKAASGALTSAIVGVFICAIILGPSAISQARKARKVLRTGDPGYGTAVAAEVIGWIAILLWVVVLIYQLSDM